MSDDLLSQEWFRFALGLVVLFPTTIILLGEWSTRLKRRDHPLADPLRLIRNGAIPLLVTWLFFTRVYPLPPESNLVPIVSTLFYLVMLAAILAIVNEVVFRSADETSWRSRVPALFLDLTRFILVLVGTSVILSTVWGKDLGGLLTALGVGSIVIGLALQDTLGNVFAGIAILFEKPYKEGDWIRYEEHLGRVIEINWRSTRLMTHFGDTVIVPNGEIARSVLMNENNLTLPRYETFDIGFSYDHPPNEVKDVLKETVAATEGVLSDPPPQVYTTNYGDSSIDYQIRFAVADIANLPAIKDDFVTRIWYAAKRHQINIPFPIRTVFHYNGERTESRAQSDESLAGRTAVSDVLPVDAEFDLSERAEVQRFGAGECITHRGESVRHLRLVVSGRVKLIGRRDGKPYSLFVGPGEIFGIEAILRNQPSTYEITCIEDAVVVKLSRDFVMELVSTKPGFAFQLEQTIENRSQMGQ